MMCTGFKSFHAQQYFLFRQIGDILLGDILPLRQYLQNSVTAKYKGLTESNEFIYNSYQETLSKTGWTMLVMCIRQFGSIWLLYTILQVNRKCGQSIKYYTELVNYRNGDKAEKFRNPDLVPTQRRDQVLARSKKYCFYYGIPVMSMYKYLRTRQWN